MFKYNHNGLRTEKNVKQNGTETTTKYIYSGTRLVHMTQGSNWLHFFYDGSGQPAEMNFNGTVYIYVKNLQGDIVGIVDTTGRIVVEYKYDAWGRPTYSNSLVDSNSTLTARYALIAVLNPFRYRGYVYDDGIDLYFISSRYYDSNIIRFINSDIIISSNLFTYCFNSPINYFDIDGEYPGEIHKQVQKHIVNMYPEIYMEIYVKRQETTVAVSLIYMIIKAVNVGKLSLRSILCKAYFSLIIIYIMMIFLSKNLKERKEIEN